MSDYNRVILLGRIGNNLELKTSAQGKYYLRLSIATHSFSGENKKTTHWHRVMVFGAQAQVCSTFLRKGSPVLVEGSLEVRTYTNQEGKKQTTVSVIANRIQFLGGRGGAELEQEENQHTVEEVIPSSETQYSAEISATL